MKIFITGISGFIGSNLAPKLAEIGHEVWGLVRYVSTRKYIPPKDVNIVFGDLIDPFFLNNTIRSLKPEIVIHLAALSSVAYSHSHPAEVTEVDYVGTINLAEANRQFNPNLKRFIFAGTSEEYGNQKIFPIREDAPLNPNQPYAIAKVASDYYLRYLKAQGFPAITARPFNTYGRDDNFNLLTESIIYQFLMSKEVVLGDPTPIRDFLYVDDHVNGYLKLVSENYDIFDIDAVNFCVGVGVIIETWAKTIKQFLGSKKEIIWCGKRPTEITKLVGDNSLAKTVLGWEPKISWRKGLELTIEKIQKKVGISVLSAK